MNFVFPRIFGVVSTLLNCNFDSLCDSVCYFDLLAQYTCDRRELN